MAYSGTRSSMEASRRSMCRPSQYGCQTSCCITSKISCVSVRACLRACARGHVCVRTCVVARYSSTYVSVYRYVSACVRACLRACVLRTQMYVVQRHHPVIELPCVRLVAQNNKSLQMGAYTN